MKGEGEGEGEMLQFSPHPAFGHLLPQGEGTYRKIRG